MSHKTLNQPVIALRSALAIIDAIRDAAEERQVALGIVVVDARGITVASARMDDAQFVALDLAEAKAFTAAAFGFPSDTWRASSAPGGADWGIDKMVGGRITPMPGGEPIIVDGTVVGGVGASGAASEVDRECVRKGLDAYA